MEPTTVIATIVCGCMTSSDRIIIKSGAAGRGFISKCHKLIRGFGEITPTRVSEKLLPCHSVQHLQTVIRQGERGELV